jgi:cyclophilin family peptidyl-prolyl cis-trans isomerase
MRRILASLALAGAALPAAAAGPDPATRPKGPVVALETSLGVIKVGLHEDKSPVSVANFLEYVKAGHYDGTVFHRVIPDFMIQGGGMDSGMKEKQTRKPIRNEAKNGLRNSRGTVAMARTNDPDSATAQFFISVRDNHRLDYGIGGAGYAVFGTVVEGMEVVDKIAAVPTTRRGGHDDVPVTAVVIQKARVEGAVK